MRRILLSLLLLVLSFVISGDVFGLPPIQRSTLANGLVLLVSEEHSLPFMTFHLLIRSGSKDDPQGKEGVAELTASSLLLGAAGRTHAQINEELDFMGAALNSGANKDYTSVTLRVLKKDLDRAFSVFMDVVTRPTFPDDELKKDITRTLAAIRSSEDRPGVVADKAFEKALHGNGPYGHPTEGTIESVSRLTREAVKAFHAAFYHPDNAILTIVGDVDEETVKKYVIPALEKWPPKPVPDRMASAKLPDRAETIKIDKPVAQANIIVGNAGISRDNPDYYGVVVMNHILGSGSLNSRLMEDIRNRRGLVYSVSSYFEALKYAGSFQVNLQTKNSSAKQAINAVTDHIQRIRSEPVAQKELDDAKKYLIGSFPQRLSTQSRIASFFSQVEYHGLGLDYPERYASLIGSVTTDTVLKVARAYLHPDTLIVVVVGNLKEAGME